MSLRLGGGRHSVRASAIASPALLLTPAVAGPLIDIDFKRGIYRGTQLSVTRASSAYQDDASGNWTPFDPGVFRRNRDKGALVEPASVNLFANPLAPATQTVTVVSGTVYTVNLRASAGSILLSGAGTGTVTPGSPVTFTASGTSLTATVSGVSGAFTMMQCEATAFASSPFVGTRAAETMTAVLTGLVSAVTVLVQLTPYTPSTNAQNQAILSLSDGTSANRIAIFRGGNTGQVFATMTVGGAAQNNPTTSEALQGSTSSKIAFALTPGDAALVMNGGTIYPATTASFPASLTQLNIGTLAGGGAQPSKAYFERLTIWPSRVGNAPLQTATT